MNQFIHCLCYKANSHLHYSLEFDLLFAIASQADSTRERLLSLSKEYFIAHKFFNICSYQYFCSGREILYLTSTHIGHGLKLIV